MANKLNTKGLQPKKVVVKVKGKPTTPASVLKMKKKAKILLA